MPFPIEQKLVIAIASSALFDLRESDTVFREHGEEAYREYQVKHLDRLLPKGVAFPFIKRLLSLNEVFPEIEPIEVVLLSRNNTETGLRVMRSIQAYNLNIVRSAFLTGKSPFKYIPAFNASLFLSANRTDVIDAVQAGYPAGMVLQSTIEDNDSDTELRIAFDFDGVIADDEAEQVFQLSHSLDTFQQSEMLQSDKPLNPGLLKDLFGKLSVIQKLEFEKEKKHPDYKRKIRTAIITARSAPAHERMITTLRSWGVAADETFFMGGIEKRRVLEIFRPHIYFDDQMTHLKNALGCTPAVHIPFGIVNTFDINSH
ncbi:MAG: 5'-nucleotidase [Bacteroidales bacterium]